MNASFLDFIIDSIYSYVRLMTSKRELGDWTDTIRRLAVILIIFFAFNCPREIQPGILLAMTTRIGFPC